MFFPHCEHSVILRCEDSSIPSQLLTQSPHINDEWLLL